MAGLSLHTGMHLMMSAAMRAGQQQRMLSIDHKLSPNHFNRAKIKAICVGTWDAGHSKKLRPSVPAQGTSKKI